MLSQNLITNYGGAIMDARLTRFLLALLIALPFAPALADEYADTIKVFRNAGQSGKYFGNSYGYAVFPTIGKGGVVVGGAHGSGRVYAKGAHVAHTSMTHVPLGLPLRPRPSTATVF